jgi:hypothetical protein
MNLKKSNRGFSYSEFQDRYGAKCSIQKSSLATEDCIWFGIDKCEPKIMASDAIKLGISNHGQVNGWVPYEIPEQVLLSTRMHLTQDMVKELLPHLQKFAETGELS